MVSNENIRRFHRWYSEEEEKILYQNFKKKTNLDELEKILGRSQYGIIEKILRLSRDDSQKWPHPIVNFYWNQFYSNNRVELLRRVKEYLKNKNERLDRIRERKIGSLIMKYIKSEYGSKDITKFIEELQKLLHMDYNDFRTLERLVSN